MNTSWPEYLRVAADQLGEGQPVRVRVVGGFDDVARDMAEVMFAEIESGLAVRGQTTLIVPVGPVDQYPLLANMINERCLSLSNVMFIAMDEYLDDDGTLVDIDHPLSFRGFLQRSFYDKLDPQLAPPAELRQGPDPQRLGDIEQLIDQRGGVDVCFGGIGINGHIAFNEPPPAADNLSIEAFAELPTRAIELDCATRTINSVTVGGELSIVPQRAITIGMREILASRKLRFYCNRPWQAAVVRRVLHGPLTPQCPASYLRTHADAWLSVTSFVAEPPDIRLR